MDFPYPYGLWIESLVYGMVYLRCRSVDGDEVGRSGVQVGGCSGRRCTDLKMHGKRLASMNLRY